MLDVVGKVVGRVIQYRLQLLATTSLPESQCGFRPGRSCADAAFSVRRIVEKSFEHRVKSFCIFVDLRKAYDSIPRAALWIALRKIGAPNSLVNLIASFHTDMKATVRVGGARQVVNSAQNSAEILLWLLMLSRHFPTYCIT